MKSHSTTRWWSEMYNTALDPTPTSLVCEGPLTYEQLTDWYLLDYANEVIMVCF